MYIKKEVYELISGAYQEWYDEISKREKDQKKAILSCFEYFKKKQNLNFSDKTGSPTKDGRLYGKEDADKQVELVDESFIQYLSQQQPVKIDPEAADKYHSEGSEEDPDYASKREEQLEYYSSYLM